jgi:predicted dehydrogenase
MDTNQLRIPEPQTLPKAPRLRWGVLGAGGIAGRLVDAAHTYSNQRFTAVAARAMNRAEQFAADHGVARAHSSYDALVADPDVDVVYIATTHNTHAELARLAIEAGKHILVEKPFTITLAEAQEVAAAARGANVFAMEAMWTRYIPQAGVIREILERGTIGDINMVAADFGFHFPFDPKHRLYNPELAGGALLDAGVYPVSFASSVLGPPQSVVASGKIAPTGVDAEAAVLIDHGGTQSLSLTSITTSQPVRATIMGTSGRLEVHSPFIAPSGLTLHTGPTFGPGAQSATWEDRTHTALHDGLAYETDAVARYLADGLVESPLHTLDETIAIVGALEDARRQVLQRAAP